MPNNQNLRNKTSIQTHAQYEVENIKQEKENTRTQKTKTEKLDRLIEAGSNPARSIRILLCSGFVASFSASASKAR